MGARVEVLWNLGSAGTTWWPAVVEPAPLSTPADPLARRLRYEAMAGFSEETRAVRFLPGPGPGLVRDPQEAQPMRWQTVAGPGLPKSPPPGPPQAPPLSPPPLQPLGGRGAAGPPSSSPPPAPGSPLLAWIPDKVSPARSRPRGGSARAGEAACGSSGQAERALKTAASKETKAAQAKEAEAKAAKATAASRAARAVDRASRLAPEGHPAPARRRRQPPQRFLGAVLEPLPGPGSPCRRQCRGGEAAEADAPPAGQWRWGAPGSLAEVHAALCAAPPEAPSAAAGGGAAGPSCRGQEWIAVQAWMLRHLRAAQGGALYVSGTPGAGKSLTLGALRGALPRLAREAAAASGRPARAPRCVALNCMAVGDPQQVFKRVLEALGATDGTDLPAGRAPALLREALRRPGGARGPGDMVVVVLDEMDALSTAGMEVLIALFEMAHAPDSTMALVGVANSLDLVLRLAPRLSQQPEKVTFAAYGHAELADLLRQRLRPLSDRVFEPAALELCARKVAAAAGDMRRLLGAARAAAEVAAAEAPAVAEGGGGGAPGEGYFVTLSHMARGLAKVFKSPVVDAIRGLPQHQQLALCGAVRLFRGAAIKEQTLGAVQASYAAVCREAKLSPLALGELAGLLDTLGDQGMLRLKRARDRAKWRVALKVPAKDVAFALQGVRLFRALLEPPRAPASAAPPAPGT